MYLCYYHRRYIAAAHPMKHVAAMICVSWNALGRSGLQRVREFRETPFSRYRRNLHHHHRNKAISDEPQCPRTFVAQSELRSKQV
jgi:hypothetical protein